jgi:Lon protease-like protein
MSSPPTRLPLFPLAGAILFPRSQPPLYIFEPRYRQMVADAVAGRGRIGMIQPQEESGEQPPLYRVGCIGEIVGLEELEEVGFPGAVVGLERTVKDLATHRYLEAGHLRLVTQPVEHEPRCRVGTAILGGA